MFIRRDEEFIVRAVVEELVLLSTAGAVMSNMEE